MSHQKPGNSPRNEFSPLAKEVLARSGITILRARDKRILRRSLTNMRETHLLFGKQGFWFVLDILKRWEL